MRGYAQACDSADTNSSELGGLIHGLDLLNDPYFLGPRAHRTAAVGTTVQTVLAHIVDLFTGK